MPSGRAGADCTRHTSAIDRWNDEPHPASATIATSATAGSADTTQTDAPHSRFIFRLMPRFSGAPRSRPVLHPAVRFASRLIADHAVPIPERLRRLYCVSAPAHAAPHTVRNPRRAPGAPVYFSLVALSPSAPWDSDMALLSVSSAPALASDKYSTSVRSPSSDMNQRLYSSAPYQVTAARYLR